MFEGIKELFVQFGKLFKWWFILAPWEQAVRVRLGKHTRVFGAGIHLLIPYIDIVYKQSTRRRVMKAEMQTLTTLDGKVVTLAGQMGYVIKNIEQIYQTLHHAEDTLLALSQQSVAEYVTANNLADVTPSSISEYVVAKVDFKQYGLDEISFGITCFAVVRTYRLLMDTMSEWLNGEVLDTANGNN